MPIQIENLAKSIENELSSYSQEVADEIKKVVVEIGKETAMEIKAAAKEKFNGTEYARGWTSKVAHEDRENIRVTVYNRTQPELTHLLENGHATRNGGRTKARPHIRPAEKAAVKKLEQRVREIVR